MNNWFKIGVPILIAVLLVAASIGITLAVTGGNATKQVGVAAASGQTAETQYARGPQCPNCPGYGQGATSDEDSATGNVYVPGGATCPNCAGYGQATTATPGSQSTGTTTNRGGCCRGR